MPVGDDCTATDVGWFTSLSAIKQWHYPRELTFVHAFSIERETVQGGTGRLAAGEASRGNWWRNSGTSGIRTRHYARWSWYECSSRRFRLIGNLRWVCGPNRWLRLGLLNWTLRSLIGQLIVVLESIVVLEPIVVLETIVVLESIRLQLGVQCMLEIDGCYDVSLGAGTRTDGLSVKGNIEHGWQNVLKREVNPILGRITMKDVSECRFARFD